MKPVSININAYLHWRDGKGEICGPHCSHVRLPWLKEPSVLLATFSHTHLERLTCWRPQFPGEARLHCMVLVALDTGLRVSEILGLRRSDVDLENLV